ncbi:MAG: type II toxin-antitoxin system VapC family toxin [Wenzhouxiangellaceae bacterium]
MNLVLDASAALAWIFERVDSKEAALAERLLDAIATEVVTVPGLWHLEIANVLLVAERRGVATEAQTIDYLQRLSRLPIMTDDAEPSRRQEMTMALARQFELSAYDAAYLELALRSGATLATFDHRLADAMRQAGGKIFGHADE